MSNLQFWHTQIHYFCILKTGSDTLTKKQIIQKAYLESS